MYRVKNTVSMPQFMFLTKSGTLRRAVKQMAVYYPAHGHPVTTHCTTSCPFVVQHNSGSLYNVYTTCCTMSC